MQSNAVITGIKPVNKLKTQDSTHSPSGKPEELEPTAVLAPVDYIVSLSPT